MGYSLNEVYFLASEPSFKLVCCSAYRNYNNYSIHLLAIAGVYYGDTQNLSFYCNFTTHFIQLLYLAYLGVLCVLSLPWIISAKHNVCAPPPHSHKPVPGITGIQGQDSSILQQHTVINLFFHSGTSIMKCASFKSMDKKMHG